MKHRIHRLAVPLLACLALGLQAKPPGNLISSTFARLNKDGLPAGWKITVHGQDARFATVTVERGKTPMQNAVIVRLPKEASISVDTAVRSPLDPAKEYLLVMQFKADDMHYIGHWYNRPAGIRIYAYGMNNKHVWLAVRGDGRTHGWVTAILPFPAAAKRNEARDFSRTNIMFHGYNMIGTVGFRSPVIVEKPRGYEVTPHFELENGTCVFGSVLTLRE